MKIGESVEIDLEENKRGTREVPGYLNGLSYKIKGEIMFSVIGLLDETLPIHMSDIQESMDYIGKEDNYIKLWSLYFQDSLRASNISIH